MRKSVDGRGDDNREDSDEGKKNDGESLHLVTFVPRDVALFVRVKSDSGL
jgi:hypothetical protein